MLKLNTAPTTSPVTLAEAKLHLRVDITDDDALITAMIAAATANAEHIMERAVMPQKWQVTLDAFPDDDVIDLRRGKVTAVDSVKYVDSTGTLTTINPSVYQLVAGDYSAHICPAFGQVWPTPRTQAEAVQVIFSCGYADAASVPEPIKAWIKMRVGSQYENRESTVVVVGGRLTLVELPFTDTLLEPFKVY